MAHDWSALLDEIESYSARRASSLIGKDEELRERRAFDVGIAGEPQPHRFVPTGIASKARRAAVSSSEPTISSILQAPPGAQQGIIALVDALGYGRQSEDDDELSRSAVGGGGNGGAPGMVRPVAMRRTKAGRSSAETTSRAAVAAGAQPVVIKVTSTVSSRASAAGLMNYLGTREVEKENGERDKVDIPLYDQDGLAIASREGRAVTLAEWGADFREAYAVNALATFSLTLVDGIDDATLHDALNAAFGSNRFLYSRHPDGKVSVYAVTDLPAGKIAGALRTRERGDGPARAVDNAEAGFASRLADAGVSAEVCILGAARSEQSGRYFLEKFLRNEKSVTTGSGDPVKRGSSVKEKADGIWRDWSSHIRTVEPRNAFHVVFSARAGTDAELMKRAVRDFLGEQVAGHRWITAHHPETRHVHVHAMISARDDVGRALRLTKPELYEWRERFAAKAREHGIAMVATRRADVAATRPYSQAQAGAYERGKTDPHYLKTPSVNKRVERKRAGVVDRASLTSASLLLGSKWHATADALQKADAQPSVIAAANRFAVAVAAAGEVVRTVSPLGEALAGSRHLIANIRQQKEKTIALSLEQFDARVLRANKSMDRLEMMVDSTERQAIEEMRREISTLFSEQRRDIEMQQMRSGADTPGAGGMPPPAHADAVRARSRAAPATVDPAIAAQQQAIAAGRAARNAREQGDAAKEAQDEQRQQILRQAEQERQRSNDRDGAER